MPAIELGEQGFPVSELSAFLVGTTCCCARPDANSTSSGKKAKM
jgi:hypothetical protein